MNEEQKENINEEPVDWENKANEYLNGWKRAMADYANREKEIGKEREALRGFFEETMVLEFLPVLDNLKSALFSVGSFTSYSKKEGKFTVGSETPYSKEDGIVRGIEQVAKLAEDILKKFGVEKMDVLDKEFDAAFAEAAERQGDGNKVIKVVLDGYKKGDRVIRAARVIVG